jgi:hypothetical protein
MTEETKLTLLLGLGLFLLFGADTIVHVLQHIIG